jgi:hypothetical protein
MNPALDHEGRPLADAPRTATPSAPPLLLAGDDEQENEDHIMRGID